MEIDLTTPALLFSAISLIMLAYTNRFLSYAQLVRTLKEQYMENPSSVKAAQIANLRKRLYLTRAMQVAGIGSLLLCVVSMFFVYIRLHLLSAYIFGLALILLIISLPNLAGRRKVILAFTESVSFLRLFATAAKARSANVNKAPP